MTYKIYESCFSHINFISNLKGEKLHFLGHFDLQNHAFDDLKNKKSQEDYFLTVRKLLSKESM